MCTKIKEAYIKYDIWNLPYGRRQDKLGDAFEEVVENIFNDKNYLFNFNNLNYSDLEQCIFKTIIEKEKININNVLEIRATTDIPKRVNGGNPKTDVLVTVYQKNNEVINIPISVKHTTAPKVAMAEYDVDTILNETGINNVEIENLMKKHQHDASAKNFSSLEKDILKNELSKDNNKYKLLRWILTMSPIPNDKDIRIPRYIIKFQLNKKNLEVKNLGIYNIDEYINCTSTDKKGNPAKGGFGTGLSWTYATGSKGAKIQFKG